MYHLADGFDDAKGEMVSDRTTLLTFSFIAFAFVVLRNLIVRCDSKECY